MPKHLSSKQTTETTVQVPEIATPQSNDRKQTTETTDQVPELTTPESNDSKQITETGDQVQLAKCTDVPKKRTRHISYGVCCIFIML